MNFAGKMRHAPQLEQNQRPGEQVELVVGIVGIIQDRRGFRWWTTRSGCILQQARLGFGRRRESQGGQEVPQLLVDACVGACSFGDHVR